MGGGGDGEVRGGEEVGGGRVGGEGMESAVYRF